jgi:hypothetical protein
VVAGWVDAAGDSSAYTANALRQFYDQTIFPLLDMFAPALAALARRFDGGLDAYFNVEDQPVVQEMRLSRLDSAVKLFGMGFAPNSINHALDLGMEDVPWGDTGYLPSGLLPAADVAEGNVFPPVPEGVPPGGEVSPPSPPTAVGGIPGNAVPGLGGKDCVHFVFGARASFVRSPAAILT